MSSPNEKPDQDANSKRKRTESASSVDAGLQPWVTSASPPRFVSLEELVTATTSLDKMALAHEIAVNSSFKLEAPSLPEGSVAKRVHDMMHKAFWDVLREQLSESPPRYENALQLLSEIKQSLLSLLLPHQTKIKAEIDENLDLELIRQECEQQCVDFIPISQYILNVMRKMCAPIRDATIDALAKCTDVVDLYKGIFETLDSMKLDMANFTISAMRPVFVQHSAEYEREQFAKFLETNRNGLSLTESWLRQTCEIMKQNRDSETKRHATSSSSQADCDSNEDPQPSSSDGPARQKLSINKILPEAYWALLDPSSEEMSLDVFPETLAVDRGRFLEFRRTCLQLVLVASIVALVGNTGGRTVADLREFKEQLKAKILAVSADCHSKEQLAERLLSMSEMVVEELNNVLRQVELPALEAGKAEMLKSQVSQLAESNQPIRELMTRRVKSFIINVISTPSVSPIKVPPGLNVIQKELARVTGACLQLISHNRNVFAPYYESLFEKIAATQL